MNPGYILLLLLLLWSGEAEAAPLSGRFYLDNQDILISETQNYHGRFDLRSKLPMDDEFVLSKVRVSFKFQDDKEWISRAGQNSLKDTGKITRHQNLSLKKDLAGQTSHHYLAKTVIYLSNEEEVAELTIGRNVYYGTTMRRREVTQEVMEQKSMLLGTYPDDGDRGRLRQHHRITETIRETRRDGYDGLFEIRQKLLDLSSTQDLAHSGVLDFELSGKGDYIFVGATLEYEGYIAGQDMPEEGGTGMFGGSLWLMLLSLPAGGFFWVNRARLFPAESRRRNSSGRRIRPKIAR